MDMALISIIIPVYNAEKYLEQCVASLVAQSDTNWEAVLVDDGSKDESGLLCDDFARKDNRIRVVHQCNQGVSAARNTGIQNARGTYVMFLDADDQLAPGTFSELRGYLDDGYDVICWSVQTNEESNPDVSSMSEGITVAGESDEQALRDLNLRAFSGWSLAGVKDSSMHFAVTKLIKRSLLLEQDIRFETRLKHHEDTLFSILVVDAAKSVVAVDRPYYLRTIHEGSATVSYCPDIHEGNRLYLQKLKEFIQRKFSQDPKYQIAYAKYQMSCFVQCLRLDCMHPHAGYSGRQRLNRVRMLLSDRTYIPDVDIRSRELKWTHRMLYALLRCRATAVLYVLAKIGFS